MHSRLLLLFFSLSSSLLHPQISPPPLLRRNRRVLHPSSSLPPTQSPSSASSAFPFFPVFSSPPPPPPPPSPTSSIPTFPANFYSLPSPSRQSHPHHLSPAIFFPLLSLALVGLSLALLLLHIRRRRRAAAVGSRGESLRLFPPGAAASDGRKPQSNHSSEFLYVGTLLNSAGAGAVSPELRPLPPLRKADVGFSSGEEKSSRKCNGAPTAMDSSEETAGEDYARNPFAVGPLEGQNPKLKRASCDNEMLWASRFQEQATKPQDIAK